MTTTLLAVASAPTWRARPIFYVRAVVALAVVGTWVVSAVSGLVVWLAPDGRWATESVVLFGATKGGWSDLHVAISFLAIAFTVGHLALMRRGVVAYGRLLLTGRRRGTPRPTRRPKAIVYRRAIVVATMVSLVPIVIASGLVPWLAADGPRSGQQLLLFAVTKHGWTDLHTVISFAAVAAAVLHLMIVRSGLATDLRLLATGQRRSPRRVGG